MIKYVKVPLIILPLKCSIPFPKDKDLLNIKLYCNLFCDVDVINFIPRIFIKLPGLRLLGLAINMIFLKLPDYRHLAIPIISKVNSICPQPKEKALDLVREDNKWKQLDLLYML